MNTSPSATTRTKRLVTGLIIVQIITALIAGAHSCDGGLAYYLGHGVVSAISAVVYILWQDELTREKKISLSLLTILIFVIVWIAGIFIGDFKILCKLF